MLIAKLAAFAGDAILIIDEYSSSIFSVYVISDTVELIKEIILVHWRDAPRKEADARPLSFADACA